MPVYGKTQSAPKRGMSHNKDDDDDQSSSLRYRRGYTYVHPRSGKKVVVKEGYIQNRSLKPEGSVAYQARRAQEQRSRSSASKKQAKCAGAPTAAVCSRRNQVLRSGTVYERKDGTEVVRCATCVDDQGRKGKGGRVKIFVESGTLYPYELSDASLARRREALQDAVERLANQHRAQNATLTRAEAERLGANTARAKLQVLSQYRKNAAKGTAQGMQCARALADEDWLRAEYGLNPLDWSRRTCYGQRVSGKNKY